MELYILRHGIAGVRDQSRYPDDSQRPLTDDGIRKMKQVAKGMKTLGLNFDLILSSPYTRARQTAEIVAKELKAQRLLELTAHLEPGGDPEGLIKDILSHESSLRSLLLVGHEPYLSEFVSMLIAGTEDLAITLKKGGICKLEVSGLRYGCCGTLEFLLAPGQIRRIR
jgi:phosphohistidine phosphatase